MRSENLRENRYYKIKYNHGNRDRDFRSNDEAKYIKLDNVFSSGSLSYTLVDKDFGFVGLGLGTFKAGDIDYRVVSVNVRVVSAGTGEGPVRGVRKQVAFKNGVATPRKRSFMKKLSAVARKVLDGDIRVLVKGGVLGDDLSIADSTELLEMLVMVNKKELAEVVTARLKEEKEDREANKDC